MTVRVIPRLDIKGPNLVKGIRFEGLRVLGKPEHYARHYYENGADELIYVDAVASLYGRNSLLDIVERTAREIFIPLTVVGGLRSLDDIGAALRAGADKVAINTAAVANPDLIREASRKFGSSTIILSIEFIRHADGSYEAYTDFGRESTGVDAFDWAMQGVALGAGEIMLTSIDRDGMGSGYDLELTKRISEAVSIPVIAGGGAGKLEHITAVVNEGRADAVSMASMIHYDALESLSANGADHEGEGNVEFLKKGGKIGRLDPCSLPEIKRSLLEAEVDLRPFLEVTQ